MGSIWWTWLTLGFVSVCVQAPCPQPKKPANGGFRYTGRNTIEYECDDGYQLEGDQRTNYCIEGDTNNNWNFPVPTCLPIMCPPLTIPNSDYTPDDAEAEVEYDTTVRYSCRDGYFPSGPQTVICGESGWDPPHPQCRDSCELPLPHDLSVTYSINSTKPGGKIHYGCPAGQSLEGPTVSTCSSFLNWDPPHLPVCTSLTCPEIGPLTHGTYFPENQRSYGSRIGYFCDEGYQPQGSVLVTCGEDGEWRPHTPHCDVAICVTPNRPPLMADHNGQEVLYSCPDDMVLVGPERAVCSDDAHWEPPDIPQCHHKQGAQSGGGTATVANTSATGWIILLVIIIIVLIAIFLLLGYCIVQFNKSSRLHNEYVTKQMQQGEAMPLQQIMV